MNKMISHTNITSQEIIKPSSPTPPHLKTRYLSPLDHFAPNIHLPLILFFKNYDNNLTNTLKKSLSDSLAAYYPLAGRFPDPSAPYIDCNDEGVEFLEAFIDTHLNDLILDKKQDETIDQLIPNALGCPGNLTSTHMAAVQLTHFACGGAAIAVSISHKVVDGSTIASFINHWAKLTRGESPTNPTFINLPSISKTIFPEFEFSKDSHIVNIATRRFVFRDSKINELKQLINNMSTAPLNPTRIEALTALLFKCSVRAATTKSGYLHPSNLVQGLNARKHITNFPNSIAGNLSVGLMVNSGENDQLSEVVTKLRDEITEFRKLRDLEQIEEYARSRIQMMVGDDQSKLYTFTSFSRYPFYEMDFGWGKPERVMVHFWRWDGNYNVFMDAPSGDGIEVTVNLEEQEMTIFQKDKQLLAYAEDV